MNNEELEALKVQYAQVGAALTELGYDFGLLTAACEAMRQGQVEKSGEILKQLRQGAVSDQ